MSREKEGFRDNIEILNQRFPDKDMLTAQDCKIVFGCSLATVYRLVPFSKVTHRISKPDLARIMCR